MVVRTPKASIHASLYRNESGIDYLRGNQCRSFRKVMTKHNMISFKQIKYALAVEQTLHFKKASDACAISQSALSTALNELEKHLGFKIFERDNKKVLVTHLGNQFLTKAKKIKLDMDDLAQMSKTNKSPLSYPMKIGFIPTICPYLLPKLLPLLEREYPQFELRFIEEQSHTLIDMVRNGDIDTAIIALPYACDGLLTFEFWQEDFYWVTHSDDPKSQLQKISSDEIEANKLMLLRDGHCMKEHTLSACKLSSDRNRINFNSISLNTLIQMVASKIGTTIVPEMALTQLKAQNMPYRAVHIDEPGPHRKIAFVTRPNFVDLASIEALKKLCREALS